MKDLSLKLLLALLLTANIAHANINDCELCPTPSCERGTFSLGGDWLYWKTEESKLELGAAIEQTVAATNTTRASVILKPKFQYDSGYRIFADYTTCNKLWKFSASYTHVPSCASADFTSTISSDYVSLLNVNFNFPILNTVSTTQYLYSSIGAKWDTSLNYCDFDVSRSFLFCKGLDITPHAGIRVLWANQSLRLRGVADDVLGIPPVDISFLGKLHSDLSSVGVEGGLNFLWNIWQNLSLIGNVGGSVLYTSSHTKGTLDISYANGTSLNLLFKDSDHDGIPMFDAFIGLQYKGCFSKYIWNLHIGWEEHIIFNTNTFTLNGGGNYTVQGLTLGAAIGF